MLLITDRRVNLGTVQHEKRLHGGMPDALVSVDEGMALDQGETQRCCLLRQREMQVNRTKGGLVLGDGRFERRGPGSRGRHPSLGALADAARRPPPARDTASGEAPVQLLVLLKHPRRRGLEVLANARQEIGNGGPRQFFWRQTETRRLRAQPLSLGGREIDREFHAPTLPWAAVPSNNRLEQAGSAGCSA